MGSCTCGVLSLTAPWHLIDLAATVTLADVVMCPMMPVPIVWYMVMPVAGSSGWGDKGLPADERPPIPFAPELEDPTWKAVYGEIEFECGHWGTWVLHQGSGCSQSPTCIARRSKE
jgi:hypothetical protein